MEKKINPTELVSGHTHSFDTRIAEFLGIHAAIVYNLFIHWIRASAAKNRHEMIDGKYWFYDTLQNMASFICYMSVDEFKKAVKKLRTNGLLLVGNHNVDKFDRTAWYTVHDQSIIKEKTSFLFADKDELAKLSHKAPIHEDFESEKHISDVEILSKERILNDLSKL